MNPGATTRPGTASVARYERFYGDRRNPAVPDAHVALSVQGCLRVEHAPSHENEIVLFALRARPASRERDRAEEDHQEGHAREPTAPADQAARRPVASEASGHGGVAYGLRGCKRLDTESRLGLSSKT